MTKVLQLGHNFNNPTDLAETWNMFSDHGYDQLADLWSALYEDQLDIETVREKYPWETISLLCIWLDQNGFSRSAQHIKKHVWREGTDLFS